MLVPHVALRALLLVGLAMTACSQPRELEPRPSTWYEIVAQEPDASVTDAAMRSRLIASGLPWKVRDLATGIELVLILPGEFWMGSPAEEAGRDEREGPRHRVRLTQPYYLGTTEVTQEVWHKLMGDNPAFFPGTGHPIESVNLIRIEEFLVRVNSVGAAVAPPMRLPTEAEWEYAARAGTTGPYSFDEPISLDKVRYLDGVSHSAVVRDGKLEIEWQIPPSEDYRVSTWPVGTTPPNPWGLYETHGNLAEWTADRYEAAAYAGRTGVMVDPFLAPAPDDPQVLRGGTWYDRAHLVRLAARAEGGRIARSNRIGFRVARSAL